MSGRGDGGDGGGAGGFPEASSIDCAQLQIRTRLSSPQPDQVEQLGVGDLLDIQLDEPPRLRVIVTTADGDVAGTITGGQLGQLIRCLQDGHTFEGEVLTVDGGDVELDIRAR